MDSIALAMILVASYVGVPILAKKKGKNPFRYFFVCLLVGPFAFIPLLFFDKNKSSTKSQIMALTSIPAKPIIQKAVLFKTDARLAICPSCGAELKKIPGAKTKCPICKESMFVRRNPKTMSRIVVNSAQAKAIDQEWAKINGTWEDLQKEKERFSHVKSKLSAQFGFEASDADVKWRLLSEDLLLHSARQNWGFYRNTLFQMGEQLRKEEKVAQALEKFLLVCYIDSCGPNNISTPLGKPSEYGQAPFTQSSAFIAPGVIKRIEKMAKKANYDLKQLEITFNNLEYAYKDSIPFPQKVQSSWRVIEKELSLS